MTSARELIDSFDPEERFLLADGFDEALIFPRKFICSEPDGRSTRWVQVSNRRTLVSREVAEKGPPSTGGSNSAGQ